MCTVATFRSAPRLIRTATRTPPRSRVLSRVLSRMLSPARMSARVYAVVVTSIFALGACTNADTSSNTTTPVDTSQAPLPIDLTGAGATLPYPLYALWFNDYAQRTGVQINYFSIGSGGGIARMLIGDVDFGATDVPMTDRELAQSATPIVHIPTIVGAVAVTYNVPGITRPLQLSGDVVADIFLGAITRWDDPRIVALNPGAALPARDIRVVHRADESGTSYIFTDYLSAVSPTWAAGPGRGKAVAWPVGSSSNGNEGVAGQVKATVGALGYVEVVYARQNRLPVAHLRNRAGKFVSPQPYEIASAAASAITKANGDMRVSLVNTSGASAYPITAFTWILVSPERLGAQKTGHLVNFLRWALTDGTDIASRSGYVALPSVTASRIHDLLDTLSATTPRPLKQK